MTPAIPRDAEIGSVRDLIAYHASRAPDAVALEAPGRNGLRYADLLGLVDATRARLGGLGLGPGARVAAVGRPSPEMAAAFLSISASAVFVPLHPLLPESAFEEALRSLRVDALLTEAGFPTRAADAAERMGLPVLGLLGSGASAGGFEIVGRTGLAACELAPEPDEPAMVIGTSGSTGRPKRVPMTRRALALSGCHTARALELTPEDRCLSFLPLSHVHGLVSGIVTPLAAGGVVVVPGAFDEGHVLDWMVSLSPTWYSAPPPVHAAIVRAVRRKGGVTLPSLRFVRSGASTLSERILGEIEELLRVPVVKAYGLSEVPALTGTPVGCRRPGSVGRSVGPEIAVVDPGGVAVPDDETGEIAVRGPTVFRGYLEDEEATASAFRDGWFLTGDLGRLDDEGFLTLDGRLKDVVNRGGDKVSLVEVERRLLQHPDVREAVAFGVPHATLGEDLAAAVVPAREGVQADELLGFLRGSLPSFQVPSRIHLVDEIPASPSGKPLRGALAETFRTASGPDAGPVTAAQTFVAGHVREVLGLGSVPLDEDFFSLGGTSLDAADLVLRMEREIGETLHVTSFVLSPTVRRFAAFLERRYAAALSRTTGIEAAKPESAPRGVSPADRLLFRSFLPAKLPSPLLSGEPKNARAVFLLSAPRSGSTLLRVLLAGHPALFAPPELRLLHFDTIAEWLSANGGPRTAFREGVLVALGEALGLDLAASNDDLAERGRRGATVKQLYADIQTAVAPRLLVDKTPLYAADLGALARIEKWFEEPAYVHLVRHPAAAVDSFERARMEQVLGAESPFEPAALGELIWMESVFQVLGHLAGVPERRQCVIRFEDLVHDPKAEMGRLCEFLNVPWDDRVLTPYDGAPSRMTAPARPGSRMIGDPTFARRARIEAGAADAWEGRFEPSLLSMRTLALANELGYDTPRTDLTPLLDEIPHVVAGWPGEQATPGAQAVAWHVGARKRPLFWCFQGPEEVAALAGHLGTGRPLYAFSSAQGLIEAVGADLRLLASRYADEILSIDPGGGPYLLGGNCRGGRIAVEIAAELLRRELPVALLCLLEVPFARRFTGGVAYFFGRESTRFNPYFSHADPESVWSESHTAWTVDLLPGDHGRFFAAPAIGAFAERLRGRLEEAEG